VRKRTTPNGHGHETVLWTRRGALTLPLGFALSACSSSLPNFMSDQPPAQGPNANPNNQIESQPLNNIGAGNVRVGLILSLSGSGNAGVAAQSMRNAAELALSEFNSPNIQLIMKDDGGNAQGARQAAEQAIAEGAEIILGPLFSHAVASAGQVTRTRSVPMIAFSTDSNVAARGIYLLSFQPENDIDRVISFAASRGKKSITGFVPDNAYGNVVEAAIKQFAPSRGAKVNAVERYGTGQADPLSAVRRAQAAYRITDLIILADGADVTPNVLQALNSVGVTPKRVQFAGAGLWDDQNVFAIRELEGAWFAAPDNSGFAGFSKRYGARFGAQPARTASLAYDAVSLVAQLVKTQGPNRFTEEVLTNRSGFAGVDGVFRFRNDGTCERSLSIMEIRGGAARVIQQAPNNFNAPPAVAN
jgi:branched-chain amino acid transport system substrate-binding protein